MLTPKKKWRDAALAILAVMGLSASLIFPGKHASAETGQAASPGSRIEAPANLEDTASLTAFVDGMMEEYMNRLQIPGAVISIVKDGKIILGKGYGSSNLEQAAPVDPATSMFESLQRPSCSLGQQ